MRPRQFEVGIGGPFVLRVYASSVEASDAGEAASGNFYPSRVGSPKYREVYTQDGLVALWLRGCGPVCSLSLVYLL